MVVINGIVVAEGQVWEYKRPSRTTGAVYKITSIGEGGAVRGVHVGQRGSGTWGLAMGPQYELGHRYWTLVSPAASEGVPW